jgi:hypothetical protein
VPSIERQIDEIRALGLPEGDEDAVAEFLDTADAALDATRSDPKLLTEGDAFAEVSKQADAIGIGACGG